MDFLDRIILWQAEKWRGPEGQAREDFTGAGNGYSGTGGAEGNQDQRIKGQRGWLPRPLYQENIITIILQGEQNMKTPLVDFIMGVWAKHPTKGIELENELRSLFNMPLENLIEKNPDDIQADKVAEALAKKLEVKTDSKEDDMLKSMYPSLMQQRGRRSVSPMTINSQTDIKTVLYPTMKVKE